MTKVTIDDAIQAKLGGTQALVLYTPTGEIFGYFHPPTSKGSTKSPFSDAEIERRSQNLRGSPLADVLKRLGAE